MLELKKRALFASPPVGQRGKQRGCPSVREDFITNSSELYLTIENGVEDYDEFGE